MDINEINSKVTASNQLIVFIGDLRHEYARRASVTGDRPQFEKGAVTSEIFHKAPLPSTYRGFNKEVLDARVSVARRIC